MSRTRVLFSLTRQASKQPVNPFSPVSVMVEMGRPFLTH